MCQLGLGLLSCGANQSICFAMSFGASCLSIRIGFVDGKCQSKYLVAMFFGVSKVDCLQAHFYVCHLGLGLLICGVNQSICL